MKKVGIVFSSFDLLHSGHVAMLSECKSKCTYLICGLQTDPTIDRMEKNRPVQSLLERYVQLDGVKYVDKIVPYDTEDDLLYMLKVYRPHVRFLGQEYYGKNFTGKQYCIDNNIIISYNERSHNYSTSELRQRVIDNERTK